MSPPSTSRQPSVASRGRMESPSSMASAEPYTSSPQLAKPAALDGKAMDFLARVAASISTTEIQKLMAMTLSSLPAAYHSARLRHVVGRGERREDRFQNAAVTIGT